MPASIFKSDAKFELRHLGFLGAESMIPNVQSRELQPIQTLTRDAQGQIVIPPGMTAIPVKQWGHWPTNAVVTLKPAHLTTDVPAKKM